MKELPKISILVITYNQEDVISRALDSILIQKEYVYEIIISDDCSTNNNWSVITRYAQQYPSLIKPYRHEKNQGIFGNMESLYNKPTGDIVFWLSGDDTFCDNLFYKTIETIEKYNIDYKNELFAIYFDHKVEYADKRPNYIFRNKMIDTNIDPVRLKHRALISNRTSCYSVKLLNKFTPVKKDIGIFADGLIDIQQIFYAEKNYYCRFIGSIYFAGIGVSVNTIKHERLKSFILSINEKQANYNLCKKDYLRYEYYKYKTLFFLTPSFKCFFKTIIYYFKSIDLIFGIKGLKIADLFKFFYYACCLSFKYISIRKKMKIEKNY